MTLRERARELRLKRLFNITAAEYTSILGYQNNCCGICGLPPRTVRLAVDHQHDTGRINGLLCMRCNRALGKFQNDGTLLFSAYRYLDDPPATRALGGERYGIRGRVTNKAKTRRRLNRRNETKKRAA